MCVKCVCNESDAIGQNKNLPKNGRVSLLTGKAIHRLSIQFHGCHCREAGLVITGNNGVATIL